MALHPFFPFIDNGKTYTYESTEAEKAELDAFTKKHSACPVEREAATGERYSITLTPGGICTSIMVRCLVCGEAEDVTDISNL